MCSAGSLRLTLVALCGVLVAGCGGGKPSTPTERLWVSGVPTNTKATISAFVTTRTSDDKYIGAFFRGSLLRGSHDVFAWTDDGKSEATLEFLQDGTKQRVRFESCEPNRGFDYCVQLSGGSAVAGRYQSRKRWAVRRPGRRAASPTLVTDAMHELADEDEDLRAAFDEAEL
jgi:hypothetical protein